MKVREVLDQVNEVKPNVYSDARLMDFLNEVEAMIWNEVLDNEPADYVSLSIPEDYETELVAMPPYSKVYGSYIQAMIDLLMGRYGLNITCSAPNINDSIAYEHYVNADRLIMMRLLSSPVFSPKTSEKKSILQSNALKVCDGFLNDHQIKLLQ